MSRVQAYHRPRTVDEALRLFDSHPSARFVAGGTDLVTRVCRGIETPDVLVSLRNVAELVGVEIGPEIRIGAATPLSDVLAHPVVHERLPALAEAIAAMGSVQIRNVGTIGGNLCHASPCADTAPPLMVLCARVRLRGPTGTREIGVEDFFLGPGRTRLGPAEILTAVLVPPPGANARSAFLKKTRVAMDLALASVAALLEMDGDRCLRARFAAGAVAPTPLRLRRVEAVIEGARLTPELLRAAQSVAHDEIAPITDVRASAEYRREIVGVLARRAAERILGRGAP